ncbi:MAG: multicopper oxidase domain-containing protein [Ancalomicrobiaceae bacterium]|nr:multicopper oxidase domain-containing protein [Ancalomicrobiaceae bacterium]
MPLSRRLFMLASASALAFPDAAFAARHHPRPKKTRQSPKVAPTPVAKLTGNPLKLPPLVEPKAGETWELTAATASHEFVAGKPVDVAGYGGTYLGPAIRLKRGETTTARLANTLNRPTNVHFHGLLVDSAADGALASVAPGTSWETSLAVDQPAATLWYHAALRGQIGADLTDGLAGMLIVEDPAAPVAGLPNTYGVDDFPLMLQDATLDDAGRPVYQPTTEAREHGVRGDRILVNGTLDALVKVPQRPVRLRLVNAAKARVFRIFLDDERSFQLIATDGGYLAEPAEIDTLVLAPGERVEIVIDFADGSASMMSTPDDHDLRLGGRVQRLSDKLDKPFRIIAFEAEKDGKPHVDAPERLPAPPAPVQPADARRRRFVLDVGWPQPGHDAGDDVSSDVPGKESRLPVVASKAALPTGTPGLPVATINKSVYAAGRINDAVTFGTTELWEIVAPAMTLPFHVAGVQFRVISEDGGPPRAWNRGPKDTVFVETSVELLVSFSRHASAARPFLYASGIAEEEDAGMMGAFTVE